MRAVVSKTQQSAAVGCSVAARAAPMREYVYFVQRHDYDHHTDRKGRMAAVSVHKTPSGANEAATVYMEREMQKGEGKSGMAPSILGDPSLNKDGLFMCQVQTFENRRDNFKLQVKKMQLHDDNCNNSKALAWR